MVLEQPVDAVRGASLLVRGEREDDVAVRDEALLFQADEIGNGDGVAVLHVLRAAAVVVAVLLDELKGVRAPILLARLHHVEMADDQDGLELGPGPAPVARHHVPLAIVRSENHHVRGRKARVAEALRHRLRGHRRASARIHGVDLDQLLENVVRALLLSLRAFRRTEGLQADRHEQGAERSLLVASGLLALGTGTMSH